MEYKSKRWHDLRASILRRDDYRCRECRRYGKVVQADTVHHAYPVELRPDLQWKPWNLVSLCAACHDAMHDRISGKLTDKGLAWCRRVAPPTLGRDTGPQWDRRGPLFPTERKPGRGVN